ncbi:CD48 antigen-like isoform X2 [Dicentrarchus labrax]|uniref:CD48 antigen-like isoform X2 n=1 Tax=Dicentrarchus labrax TaxID=13489 RepID=UPI0021F61DB9|nr:CD48 antigen-like isoform X2 [Dicentrarchus labrax]
METISYVCAVFLVYLCQLQGSSAETPVFVQKGNDVLLNVEKADVVQDIFSVVWKLNEKDVLIRFSPGREPIVLSNYTGRVEFSVNNYSLKVKNLQETDSGVYTARVTRDIEELTEYNVTVQDAVSPVKLKVDSVSRSSDSCNLTVTCNTQDSHINSTIRCDTKTCSQEGGEQSEVTTSGASLHVYLVNHSIICNHSNQVNWTKDIEMTEHLCPQHAVAEQPHNNIIAIVIVMVPVAIVFIIIVAAFFYLRKRRTCPDKRENTENTIYAVPEMETVAQPPNPTIDASDPSTLYSLVGTHTGPTETRGNTLPESLYAEVENTARS